MSEPRTYKAEAWLEDGWWMVSVPELDIITQASRWSEVERMGRDLIASWLDVEIADVAVAVSAVPDPEAAELLAAAAIDTAEAQRLNDLATQRRRDAARHLQSAGWKLAAIGSALGVSYQRADQLIRGSRT